MLFDILALISVLTVIILLKRLLNIFPSLLACIVRWKESVNLEASVKHSLDRDMIAIAMILPFCLTVYKFGLYTPKFMTQIDEAYRLPATIGVILVYIGLRYIMGHMFRSRKINPKIQKAAGRSAFTFFTILTLLLIGTGSVMSFMKIAPEVIRSAMLWVSAAIYCIFIIRKTQIFASSCSIFTAFLYLCAPEIFPTGALVASALIL